MRTIRYFALILSGLFLCPVCFGYFDGDGTVANPYQISDSNDLLELANTPTDYNQYFVLTADIDLQGQIFDTAIIAKDTDNVTEGFQGTAFTGFFDGGGHKISNFIIDGGSNHYLGLFGQIDSGTVKNLGLENCTITYSSDSGAIGGLVGDNLQASISHCYMAGDVIGDSNSILIGGLVGVNRQGVIDHCYTTGNVGGLQNATYAGGLVGLNGLDGVITSCYSTGAIYGNSLAGGLCGGNSGIISHCYASGGVYGPDESENLGGLTGLNFGTLSSCFATGAVNGGNRSSILGGLCGENSSDEPISNSYATGSVTGGDSSRKLGGLCGENSYGAIINCYCTGAVAGGNLSNYLGGLCGYQSDSEISNSFWNVETSNMTVGYNLDAEFPGTIAYVFGMTTGLMRIQSTFTDYYWDFVNETANGTEDIWQMCADGVDYPKLAWQFTEGGFVCPASGYGPKDLTVMANCWLSVIQASADINKDHTVNLLDLAILGQYWQQFDCGICGGADVTGDGNVDEADLMKIADQWLVIENADCKVADLSGDNEVDLADVAILAQHWLEGV